MIFRGRGEKKICRENGLLTQLLDTSADSDDPDDQLIDIEGEPLSETAISQRRCDGGLSLRFPRRTLFLARGAFAIAGPYFFKSLYPIN